MLMFIQWKRTKNLTAQVRDFTILKKQTIKTNYNYKLWNK